MKSDDIEMTFKYSTETLEGRRVHQLVIKYHNLINHPIVGADKDMLMFNVTFLLEALVSFEAIGKIEKDFYIEQAKLEIFGSDN
jgi:hypothetical protein